MNLIEAFEQNLIDKLNTSSPDKTIETIISKIFFYGNEVMKVYKYEKFFFGDFSLTEFRKNFYKEDFDWNKKMAPDVYLELIGVKKSGGGYELAQTPEAEDFFIKMKKFDDNNNLTNLLLEKKIDKIQLEIITKKMILRIKELTDSKREKYKNYFEKNLLDIHLADLESDKNLLYLISAYVPKEKTDEIIGFAKKASENNQYYSDYDSGNLSILIDNHADNIVFLNGKIQFIDVLPPKESWRIGDLNFVICRLATDTAILGSPKLAEAVYGSCKPMPEKIKHIYEIRSALIQTSCFYSVNKPEIARKYLKFAEMRGLDLCSGIG